MPVKVGLQYIEIWNESMEDEVREYENEPIQKGKIVFYGPSYFTRWSTKWGNKPLCETVLGKSGAQCCINRGFGSSCPEHQLYYYPRMIRPLEPSVLVYKSYANAAAFGYTTEETWELAQRVITYTLTDFPEATVYLVSASRSRNMSDEQLYECRKYNSFLKEFAEKTPRCQYLDVFEYAPMTGNDIYIDDGVHFNEKGYELFADFFTEALKDELAKF
ncbi:MAG: hypothetical protein IJ404_07080 [Clostridia bacterium]|nr:hypothetical protein [Clostridia bacterium]